MSNSKLNTMAKLTMMAGMFGDYDLNKPELKLKPKHNETKKCFKEDCTNHRVGDSLYCSDECQQVYHKYLKEKESNNS